MGSLPTQVQINTRAKEAQTKLRELKSAYDNFIQQWEQIEKEEVGLLQHARQHLDTGKMQAIISKIHSS